MVCIAKSFKVAEHRNADRRPHPSAGDTIPCEPGSVGETSTHKLTSSQAHQLTNKNEHLPAMRPWGMHVMIVELRKLPER